MAGGTLVPTQRASLQRKQVKGSCKGVYTGGCPSAYHSHEDRFIITNHIMILSTSQSDRLYLKAQVHKTGTGIA